MNRSADFALIHGRIWSPGLPRAAALAARDGRVIAVGRDGDIAGLIGSDTRVLDAGGRRVIPGLIDAHLHLLPGGLRMNQVDVSAADDRAAFVAAIEDFVRSHSDAGWILGGGWSGDRWPDRADPHRDHVDPITGDRPLFLYRLDCHAALANSAALAIAAITRDGPPDPPGGRIERDAATGEPTGLLRDAAMKRVADRIPPPTDAERDRALQAAIKHANQFGLTMVHNMLDAADAPTFERFHRECRLTLRLFNVVHQQPDAGGIQRWRAMQPGDDWMRCGGCKTYMDGSLGSRTAWMLEPYARGAGPESPCGLRVDGAADEAAMMRQLREADRAGLQLIAHAIGDAANRRLLDLIERIDGEDGSRDRRPRIEHAQHVADADVARFARVRAVASMQPLHKFEDGGYAEHTLGATRARTSYRFRDLLEAGVVLAFGSDWPVVSLNPFEGIGAAVTGRTRGGNIWMPEQNLCVADALRAYTTGAAYACGMEDRLGRLLPGYYADLVVLDDDPFTIAADGLRNIRPTATVVQGRVVFEGAAQPPSAVH
ncbi:MAG: amidohydrolase [Phycisphaerae bacterium]